MVLAANKFLRFLFLTQYLCECSILTCYVEFFFGSPYMSKIRKNAYVGRTNTHVYKYSFNTQGGQKISRRVVNSNTMQQQSLERRLQKNICVEIRIRFVKRSYKCVVSRKICNWILPPWILGENYSKMGCLHPYEALTTRMAPYRFRNERTQWLHERRLQWISECVYCYKNALNRVNVYLHKDAQQAFHVFVNLSPHRYTGRHCCFCLLGRLV